MGNLLRCCKSVLEKELEIHTQYMKREARKKHRHSENLDEDKNGDKLKQLHSPQKSNFKLKLKK